MILTLAVSGYRSIRDLALPLSQLTVITGSNGSGKSSLYRSLRLLNDVAHGRVISSLAQEGGLSSVLWAGPEVISRAMRRGDVPVQGGVRKGSVALRLGFASEDYGYAVDLGLPLPPTAFPLDPEIKSEALWVGEVLGLRNSIADRKGPGVFGRDPRGRKHSITTRLPPFDSMMTHAADPTGLPELTLIRDRMRGWRFYDHLRTDRDSAARKPSLATYTPVLAHDGADLAAAVKTILAIGDADGFAGAIAEAFPGARIEIEEIGNQLSLHMHQEGLLRPLNAAELSDGTLRYILLAAALLSPRPPSLMVLNEPETSLHPELIEPLGELIADAAKLTQIIVVSHSKTLASTLRRAGASTYWLSKELGETRVPEAETDDWTWPKRQ